MVSAWAGEYNLVLGQVKTDEKSNEITAIAELLKVLYPENTTVTIDAMGWQETIASKIINKEADYILAVKENQKQLYQNIADEFRFGKNIKPHTSQELDHGRIENRACFVLTDFEHIENPGKWKNLKSIIKIENKMSQ